MSGISALQQGAGITVQLIRKGYFEWLPHLLFSIRSWWMMGAGKIGSEEVHRRRRDRR